MRVLNRHPKPIQAAGVLACLLLMTSVFLIPGPSPARALQADRQPNHFPVRLRLPAVPSANQTADPAAYNEGQPDISPVSGRLAVGWLPEYILQHTNPSGVLHRPWGGIAITGGLTPGILLPVFGAVILGLLLSAAFLSAWVFSLKRQVTAQVKMCTSQWMLHHQKCGTQKKKYITSINLVERN